MDTAFEARRAYPLSARKAAAFGGPLLLAALCVAACTDVRTPGGVAEGGGGGGVAGAMSASSTGGDTAGGGAGVAGHAAGGGFVVHATGGGGHATGGTPSSGGGVAGGKAGQGVGGQSVTGGGAGGRGGATATGGAGGRGGATAGGAGGAGGLCAAALPLGCSERVSHSTTVQGRASVWGGYNRSARSETGRETVYAVRALSSCTHTATLTSPGVDLDLFLLSACDAGPSNLAASSTPLDLQTAETVSWTAAPGSSATYYLVVDGYAGAEGSYTLSLACACP